MNLEEEFRKCDIVELLKDVDPSRDESVIAKIVPMITVKETCDVPKSVIFAMSDATQERFVRVSLLPDELKALVYEILRNDVSSHTVNRCKAFIEELGVACQNSESLKRVPQSLLNDASHR